MKFRYTAILMCLFNLVKAQTDINLKGKITDSKTNNPVEQVTIFIPEYRKINITDTQGQFAFSGLGKGNIKLEVTCIGYKSVVKTIDLSTTSEVNISVEPSSMELEEIVVTSNNTNLSGNIPYSVQTISIDELRKTGALTPMQALSYQPGIDRISIGNGIGKPVIRGLSFNQIMLYGQGTRIENQQWDDHHDLGLSDIGVENVEIVRGPAALIYGADALGGALVFNDEKPASAGTIKGDANLGYASNTFGFNGDVGLKGANKSGLFYGVRMGSSLQTSYLQGESEEEDNVSGKEEEEEFAFNSKMINLAAKANAGISKSWGVSKLSYSFFNQQIGIIEDESGDTLSSEAEDEEEQREIGMEAPYQDVTTHIISVENTILTGKSKLNINLAYQMNDRKEFEPLPDKKKEKAIGLKLNVTTYDLKWTSNADKKFGVTVGSQGTFLENKNNGLEALVPDADVSNIAGFALLRYDTDKLNLLGGVRVDTRSVEVESYEPEGRIEENTFVLLSQGIADTIPEQETELEKTYTPVSFSLGAAYHLTKEFTIKLNGATGFSAPNYAQLGTFGKHEGTYRFERGNTALKVEQNLEGDLGLSWENESVTLSIGGYINKVNDYIYIQNSGDTIVRISPEGIDTLPVYDYRQGDATLSGGEVGFDIHPKAAKWIDVSASYSMTKGTLDDGGNLPYIPAGKFVGALKLSREKIAVFNQPYFSFVVSNYAKQKDVAQYELSTDGYTLLDAHIGSSFKWGKQKVTFDIFCTNLLNTGYYNQLSLVKYIGVRDMGRNIGFQLHIPFGIKG